MESTLDMQKYLSSLQEADFASQFQTSIKEMAIDNSLKLYEKGTEIQGIGENLMGLGGEMFLSKVAPEIGQYALNVIKNVKLPDLFSSQPVSAQLPEQLAETSEGIEMQNFANMPLPEEIAAASTDAETIGGGFVNSLSDIATNVASQVVSDATGALNDATNLATQTMGSFTDSLTSTASQVANQAMNFANTTSNAVVDTATSAGEAASDAVSSTASAVVNAVSSTASDIVADATASAVGEAAGAALSGAAEGAAMGAELGPIGVIGGLIIGGLISFFTGKHDESTSNAEQQATQLQGFVNPASQFL